MVFVLQHVTDRGVHQPDMTDVGGAVAVVVEATLGHHVEHELSGLEEPSLRVGHELCGALEYDGVLGAGIARRDRRHPQGQPELRDVLGEQVLRRCSISSGSAHAGSGGRLSTKSPSACDASSLPGAAAIIPSSDRWGAASRLELVVDERCDRLVGFRIAVHAGARRGTTT